LVFETLFQCFVATLELQSELFLCDGHSKKQLGMAEEGIGHTVRPLGFKGEKPPRSQGRARSYRPAVVNGVLGM